MKKIGGMATFNGVLLRDEATEVNAYYIDDDIYLDKKYLNTTKYPIFIRGYISLVNMYKLGIKYITDSAEYILKSFFDVKYKITNKELGISYFIAFVMFILIYIIVPNVISCLTNIVFLNIAIKVIIFAIYIFSITKISFLDELFKFHSAEHMSVNYYEKEEIPNNIFDFDYNKLSKYDKFNKRCGSNFVTILFILSCISTIFLPLNNIIYSILIELVVFIFLIGITYEIFKYISFKPLCILQKCVTKVPDIKHVYLAFVNLLYLNNKEIILKEFIDRYINTIKNYNYEVKLNDILIVISNYLSEDKNKLYVNINSFKLDILEQVDIKRLLDDYYINYIPLEYITNKKEFFKEKFYINNTVLIPRSDSELLVEVAIKYITENKLKSCLDMCSGSGAIGISIANNSNISNVDLVDIIDPFVLKMNKNNLDRNYKCNILTSDLFTNLTNKYDIIVSNPPYIQTNVIDTLTEYVKAEPLIALDGKEDGIYFYDQILSKANMYLNDDAYVIFEIGYDLNNKVIELINKYNFEYIETLKDINNLDRVIVCHFVKK